MDKAKQLGADAVKIADIKKYLSINELSDLEINDFKLAWAAKWLSILSLEFYNIIFFLNILSFLSSSSTSSSSSS